MTYALRLTGYYDYDMTLVRSGVLRLPRPQNLAQKAFTVLALLLLAEALLPLLRSDEGTDQVTQNNPLLQLVWIMIYGVVFLVVIRDRRFINVATRDKLLLILVGSALASALWSAVPEVTLRQGVALAGSSMFGVYLAMRYSLRE